MSVHWRISSLLRPINALLEIVTLERENQAFCHAG
jgi:hypothetical protein